MVLKIPRASYLYILVSLLFLVVIGIVYSRETVDGGKKMPGLLMAPADAPSPLPLLSVPNVACDSCIADFAIYDPPVEDDGVWEEEVIAVKAMLDAFGFTYQIVTARDINSGFLGTGETRKFRALIQPGGWAYTRITAMTPQGERSLQDFVRSGGNYIGFCAGAYATADRLVFAEQASGNKGTYNRSSDYQDYSSFYTLDLFSNGIIKGPFGWVPWNPTQAGYDIARINQENETMKTIGLPSLTRFFYAGGPFFEITNPPKDYEVWAVAQAPEGISPEASIGDGKPTIIRYSSGEGTVILFSYHPEILIGDDRDNVTLKTYYNEKTLSWEKGNQTQEEINVASWNIVHAALQLSTDREVTPLLVLP